MASMVLGLSAPMRFLLHEIVRHRFDNASYHRLVSHVEMRLVRSSRRKADNRDSGPYRSGFCERLGIGLTPSKIVLSLIRQAGGNQSPDNKPNSDTRDQRHFQNHRADQNI
jgi:hypothetical protein